jgi:acetyltransferase-like isoleucine patch superfamily enzyme
VLIPRRLLNHVVHTAWAWIDRVGVIAPGTRLAEEFGSFGAGSALGFPVAALFNADSIHVGEGTLIGRQCSLSVGYGPGDADRPERGLVIGDRGVIGGRTTITAHESVLIGDDVWFGHDVFVTDASHGYQDPDVPIGQPRGRLGAHQRHRGRPPALGREPPRGGAGRRGLTGLGLGAFQRDTRSNDSVMIGGGRHGTPGLGLATRRGRRDRRATTGVVRSARARPAARRGDLVRAR